MSGKEVEDLGGDEIKRGEAPEKKPGESDGARHATRFRSLVSEFRTVKKEVAVQVRVQTWVSQGNTLNVRIASARV